MVSYNNTEFLFFLFVQSQLFFFTSNGLSRIFLNEDLCCFPLRVAGNCLDGAARCGKTADFLYANFHVSVFARTVKLLELT